MLKMLVLDASLKYDITMGNRGTLSQIFSFFYTFLPFFLNMRSEHVFVIYDWSYLEPLHHWKPKWFVSANFTRAKVLVPRAFGALLVVFDKDLFFLIFGPLGKPFLPLYIMG